MRYLAGNRPDKSCLYKNRRGLGAVTAASTAAVGDLISIGLWKDEVAYLEATSFRCLTQTAEALASNLRGGI